MKSKPKSKVKHSSTPGRSGTININNCKEKSMKPAKCLSKSPDISGSVNNNCLKEQNMKTKKNEAQETVNISYISLATNDFSVDQDNNPLKILSAAAGKKTKGRNNKDLLFKNLNGRWTHGLLAHFGNEYVNVEIYSKVNQNPMMVVSFSPAMITECGKYNGINVSQLPHVIDRITTLLKDDVGIHCSLDNSIVSTIYFQKTIVIPYKSKTAFKTIQNLQFNDYMGMHIMSPNNILWKNCYYELAIYEVPIKTVSDNTARKGDVCAIRFEYRLNRHDIISRFFETHKPEGITVDAVNKVFFSIVGPPFYVRAEFNAGKESMKVYEEIKQALFTCLPLQKQQ